jgi:hypothetical protein
MNSRTSPISPSSSFQQSKLDQVCCARIVRLRSSYCRLAVGSALFQPVSIGVPGTVDAMAIRARSREVLLNNPLVRPSRPLDRITEMRIAKYEVVRDRNIRVVLAIAPPYQPEARQVEKPTKPPEMPIGLSHKDVERCVGISGQSAAVISRARALRAFSSAVRGPLSFDFDFDDFLALGK